MNSTIEQKQNKGQGSLPQKKKEKKVKGYFFYDFVKITGCIPMMLFLRTKVICTGETKPTKVRGGAIISSNHFSFMDPVVVYSAFWNRRVLSVATKDLYSSPAKDFFFTHLHCIKVDKENFTMDTFHKVREGLKKEKLVLIFPEGQVNRDADKGMLAFKSGAILMAHQCNKPIIPVYIVKRGSWRERQVIMIGDPVDVRKLCGPMPSMAQLDRASEYLHEKEVELLNKYEEIKNKTK